MTGYVELRGPDGELLAVGNCRPDGMWLVWQRPARVVRSWGEVAELLARTGGEEQRRAIDGADIDEDVDVARRSDEPYSGESVTLPGRRADQTRTPKLSSQRARHRVRRPHWRTYVVGALLLFGVAVLVMPLSCAPAHAIAEPETIRLGMPTSVVERLSGDPMRWRSGRADRSRWIDRSPDQSPGRHPDHVPAVDTKDDGWPSHARRPAPLRPRPVPAAALHSHRVPYREVSHGR